MTFNKPKGKSIIEEALERKERKNAAGNFTVSFEHYDCSQKYGSSFLDWQNVGLLSYTLELLHGYCKRPLREQVDGKKFTIYGDFPPEGKTLFVCPKMIPVDAEWARIHINNKTILVGHIIGNTFYVVFLDKTHKFWMTKLARGEK